MDGRFDVTDYEAKKEFIKNRVERELDFRGYMFLYCPDYKYSKSMLRVSSGDLRNLIYEEIEELSEDEVDEILSRHIYEGEPIVESVTECWLVPENHDVVMMWKTVPEELEFIADKLKESGVKYGLIVDREQKWMMAKIVDLTEKNPDEVKYFDIRGYTMNNFLNRARIFRNCLREYEKVRGRGYQKEAAPECFRDAFSYSDGYYEREVIPIRSFEDVKKVFEEDEEVRDTVCRLLRYEYERFKRGEGREEETEVDFRDKVIRDIMVDGCGISV